MTQEDQMQTTPQHQQIAEALLGAYRTGEPVAPPREQLEGMTLDDAYAVQFLQEQHFVADGDPVVGRKIGLTSFAMQEQLGVDQPDFGFVTASRAHGDGAHFAPGDFISPKVEPELALVLGKDLKGPGVTLEQAIDAVASVHAALEIIDSRVANWDIKLVDTVADNASCGAIAWAAEAMDVDVAKLDEVSGSLLVDGQTLASGKGSDVMGHPVAPLAWLANVLGERGVVLSAGQVVLTGSFTAAAPVTQGSTAAAEFGELGRLEITF